NSTDSPSVYSPFQFNFIASGTISTLGEPNSTDSPSVYSPFQFNFIASGTISTLGEPNSTDSPSVYSPFQFNFIASGTISTLRFSDFSDAQSGGGGFDAMLDHVRVAAVPEPTSLTLLGLSVFAFLGRRKPQFISTLRAVRAQKSPLDA
ncbi:MAG: PEP-CTERM sorting domain-containing protein, partial [Planctomycetales bacterium]|nr:PEP-CTERM sorting domain-containing protein [Planctomycetales bacterium]